MLFRQATLEGIAAGRITLAFRRWNKPAARSGGRQRTQIGVLAIDAVEKVTEEAITVRDAKAAGYTDHSALIGDLGQRGSGDIYRIRFHLAGEDPRIVLRDKPPAADEIEAIMAKLERLDRASRTGDWTSRALALIKAHPGRRAPELAQLMKVETAPFKRNIRKLKELGLTISLEVGYRLSPRGEAVAKRLKL